MDRENSEVKMEMPTRGAKMSEETRKAAHRRSTRQIEAITVALVARPLGDLWKNIQYYEQWQS
mgnify:CR=1 FL=1